MTAARYTKIVVTFERREDGGLRAYSNDVPGFVLSNQDPNKVIDAIVPAMEFILSSMWGVNVEADVLSPINNEDSTNDYSLPKAREYVAHVS